MQRYALFHGQEYYPGGGWNDFQGTFATVAEALAATRQVSEWYQVVDLQTGAIVHSGES